MIITLSTEQAIDRLLADSSARWSYEGARALVEHIQELEDELGETIECDVVAIRCDFTEYGSVLEAAQTYGYDGEDTPAALEWLEDRCQRVIQYEGGVIVGII